MTEIAILTPDSAAADHTLWRNVLTRLQQALSVEDIVATSTPWTRHAEDAAGLREFACVLPLLAWGYHLQPARWSRACHTWREAGIAIANPADVLAWNADKRYLSDLAARGVAIPYTVWTRQPDAAVLEQAFADTGAAELVVKPSVSGGAWSTLRVSRDGIDAAIRDLPADVELLVQPYLPTIASAGETSLLYFGGVLSHAVNKRPVPGDFRVQEEFGGLYALVEPPAEAVALAQQVLAAIDAPLLYARIDMLPDDNGHWLLMEAELIEPDFYLGVEPAAGGAFARALRGWLQAGTA